MSQPRRRRQGQGKKKPKQPSTREFWGTDPAEDEPLHTIRALEDPTPLVRSLGPPPLPGHEQVAVHYFAAMYDKAASLANALAATAGLLAAEDEHE
jgi:hypothetical protein